MGYPLLLGLALVSAVLNWAAVEKKWKKLEYVVKPATMVILIIWFVMNGGLRGAAVWFVVGALFSLGGDIFLMLPSNLFLFGLVSFLLGHVFYILGFNTLPIELSGLAWLFILTVAVVLVLVIRKLLSWIVAGLTASGTGSLKLPVLIYAIVISLMVFSALMCLLRPGWQLTATLWAIAGALLFYLSDSILALDRFVKPINHGRLLVMTSYHLGQLGILLSAALTFLG